MELEEKKLKIESSYKLIQFSALAIATLIGAVGFFQALSADSNLVFFLIPLFFFSAAISSAVCNLMELVDEATKGTPDIFFRLIKTMHLNMLFRSWYLFLCGILSFEVLVFLKILEVFNITLF